jgi:ATP-dependent DNA ligase
MALPFSPPLPPMLAKLGDTLPEDGYVYEPKLDGFRCLAFRDGADVELQSRHGNPLARYFPEVVEAVRGVTRDRFVLDGELVPLDGDFPALMQRLHPAASRVGLLARQRPAALVAFDLLADGDESLVDHPFAERRARLETLLDAGPVAVGDATASRDEAAAWLDAAEGVVAKQRDSPYLPGKRAWVKVKRRRTAECVVAGFRWRADRPLPSSLLLGLYDDASALEHVGVASGFGVRQAESLLEVLRPTVTGLGGHPWEHGFLLGGGSVGRLRGAAGRWSPGMTMDWTPVAPVLVAEVSYDQVDERRFRHPARFVRWREDRDPRSCTFAQFT